MPFVNRRVRIQSHDWLTVNFTTLLPVASLLLKYKISKEKHKKLMHDKIRFDSKTLSSFNPKCQNKILVDTTRCFAAVMVTIAFNK